MDQKICIRQLQAEDWSEFRAVRLEALQKYKSCFSSSYETEKLYDEQKWQGTLQDTQHAIFAILDEDKAIGLSGCFTSRDDESGKTAILGMWYLKEEYRGQGLFHLLMQATMDWAKDEGRFDRIVVSHREGNEASRRANQALGFKYTETVMNEFGDGQIAKNIFYEVRLR